MMAFWDSGEDLCAKNETQGNHGWVDGGYSGLENRPARLLLISVGLGGPCLCGASSLADRLLQALLGFGP